MIVVDGLRKLFRTAEGMVPAVNGISFNVAEGKFFTLLGPSGCGKTTTLRCLAGLERPDEGELRLGNQVVFSAKTGTLVSANRRPIGMVFQSYAIWPHMTVFENVAYPLEARKRPPAEIRQKVMRALELVGMADLADRPAPRLSGGQQQRVALARAVVAEPAVLLLDEPLSNLDAKLRAQMRSELQELQRKVGVTSLYVTHDQQEALAMSDHVAVMNKGVIVQVGTPEEIYLTPHDRFTASFIGTTNLLEGRVTRRQGDGLIEVETEVGPIRACVADASLLGEARVALSVRPEAIVTSTTEPERCENENFLEGRVARAVFLGETVEYDVRVGEAVFHVRGNAFRRLVQGERVYMTMPANLCTAVRAESPDAHQADRSEPRGAGAARRAEATPVG